MYEKPFWMKGYTAQPAVATTEVFPIGPAVSQAEAEDCGAVVKAVNSEGVVVDAATVEVLPPEALACINVQGIAAITAQQLKAEFRAAFADAASVLAEAATVQVTGEDQTAEMAKAKALRLRLKSIRCDVENVRKTQKADSLLRGKAIDGAANALKGVIEPAEAWLLEQEQFAERADKLRRDQLHDQRLDALRPYVDVLVYCQGVAVEDLTPEAFDAFLEGAKMQAQVRSETERTEAEALRRQEEARKQRELDNETERLRLKAENDRLQAEQAARDADNAKLREEAAKQLAATKRLEEEVKRKQEEEAREKSRLAEIERKAASAPDKEKALAYLSALRAVPLPAFTSEAGKRVSADIERALDGFCKIIAQGVNNEL